MNTIKRLELFGFKSFYNRQDIPFTPNMNVIMGPNGSGKSNVIDALTFVLGKSSRKELRAEKMCDLVFNGNKKLPPAKFAKVTVVIDNKNRKMPIDEDEVKIIRQVNTDGFSIFKVNGKRAQKEYIKNLLYHAMIDPDGYNIVMQGEIEQFIAMPGEERRKIIEDLSGISIYEEKKHKCMLELEKVQVKINDARIILNEKIKFMEELQKDKEQAEKVADLQGKQNYKKAAKITVEMREFEKTRDGFQKQFDAKNNEINKHTEAKNKIVSKMTDGSETLEKLNKELEQKGEVEQVDLSKQIETLRNRLNELKTLIKSGTNEIKRVAERKGISSKDLELNQEKLREINKKIEGINSELNSEKALLKDQEEKFEKLKNIDNERIRILIDINRIESATIELKKKLADLQKLIEMQKEKEGIEKQLSEMVAERSAKLEQDSELSAKIGGLEKKITELSKELHILEGKQEAQLQMLDRSVKVLMQAKKSKKLEGIHGVVSELGKASDEYTLPLKVAARGLANAIVVDDIDSVKRCVEFLRRNMIGSATLLALDTIKGRDFEKRKIEHPGFIGYAIDLIKFKSQYSDIFRFIFKDTMVVKDFEAARQIGIKKYRMVTLAGDMFDKSGVVHGGFRQKKEAGFKEESFGERIENYRAEIDELQADIDKLTPEHEKLSDEISILHGRIFNAEEKLKGLKNIDLSEIEKINSELKKRDEEYKERFGELKELPGKVAQEHLNRLNDKIKAKREKITLLEGSKIGHDVEISILNRDIERAAELARLMEKETVRFEKMVADNEKELASVESSLAKKLEEEKKFHGKLDELYTKRNNLMEELKELEIERNKIEVQVDVLRGDAQDIQLKIAENSAKIEGKLTALQEFKGTEVKTVRESPEELAKQIEELQSIISKFGNVNMKALEAYKEIEREYNSLKERTEKLFAEKEEVIQVISEVEGQKKETFMQTFDNIAKSFSHVFSVISIKGEGKLVLENPEDPFAGGVEIIARPGGKKMVSLRSMSGGEKTMTTLAFIFAVQECSPSPFYIMDEVDAALDKENAERLGSIISEYAKESQFILISHNDSVIAQGDAVYGVEVNELGESRALSYKMPAK